MKISHSASPRNRSRRNSRSPPTGIEIAGTEAAGARASRTGAFASPARGGPSIRSAIEVIWHHLGQVGFARRPGSGDSIGPGPAGKLRRASQRRGRALDWNYGETTIGILTTTRPQGRPGDWFGEILSI